MACSSSQRSRSCVARLRVSASVRVSASCWVCSRSRSSGGNRAANNASWSAKPCCWSADSSWAAVWARSCERLSNSTSAACNAEPARCTCCCNCSSSATALRNAATGSATGASASPGVPAWLLFSHRCCQCSPWSAACFASLRCSTSACCRRCSSASRCRHCDHACPRSFSHASASVGSVPSGRSAANCWRSRSASLTAASRRSRCSCSRPATSASDSRRPRSLVS